MHSAAKIRATGHAKGAAATTDTERVGAESDYVRAATVAARKYGVGGVDEKLAALIDLMRLTADTLTDEIAAMGGRR